MAEQKKAPASTGQNVIEGYRALQGLIAAAEKSTARPQAAPVAAPAAPGPMAGLKSTLYGVQSEDGPDGMHTHAFSPSGSTPGVSMPEEGFHAGRDSVLAILRNTLKKPANWHPGDVNLPIK